jgi:hypothetical protein
MTNSRILLIVGFVTVFLLGIFIGINLQSSSRGQVPQNPDNPPITGTASCVYNGKTYAHGASFKDVDGCNSCGCNNGEVACTLMACSN